MPGDFESMDAAVITPNCFFWISSRLASGKDLETLCWLGLQLLDAELEKATKV
jgi:hypothetical protein